MIYLQFVARVQVCGLPSGSYYEFLFKEVEGRHDCCLYHLDDGINCVLTRMGLMVELLIEFC